MKIKGKYTYGNHEEIAIDISVESLAKQLSQRERIDLYSILKDMSSVSTEPEKCECKEARGMVHNACMKCGKPIPAEKKECEHKWDGQGYWCLLCGNRNPNTLKNEEKHHCDDHSCPLCYNPGNYDDNDKPEPKPKDRIEPILKQDYQGQHKELRDKLNAVIQRINERGDVGA